MLYNKLNLSVAKIADIGNSSRPELGGVFFTRNKTVASDGFRLLEISVDNSVNVNSFPLPNIMRGCSPFIVDARGVKLMKLKESFMALRHLDDKRASFVISDGGAVTEPSFDRVDRRFPDYEPLIPKGQPKAEITFNAKYLSELLNILGEFNKTREVTLKIYGNDKPIVLETRNEDQKGRAVLMPIKK